jgi:hypothetical protein
MLTDTMTDEKRADLLMVHYNETFQHILFHWKIRNRLFLFILVLLAIFVLDAAKPGSIAALANAVLTKVSSPEVTVINSPEPTTSQEWLDFSAIGSLTWFILLCLLIQYYQRSMHVSRQYTYIAKVEEQLCALMGADYVTREGKAYLSRTGAYQSESDDARPLFLRTVGSIYVYLFPLLLTGLVLWKIVHELCFDLRGAFGLSHVLDIVSACAILFYNMMYVRWIIANK